MRATILSLLVLFVVACSEGVGVIVEFSSDQGLKAGDAVYLGDVRVGEVDGVDRTGDGVRVMLRLEPKLIAELRQTAAAMVTIRDDKQVVTLYNSARGEPVATGAQLVGLDSGLELAIWQAGGWMDQTQRTLETTLGAFEDYFNSDQWRQQKEQMREGIESLDQATREAMDEAYDELDRLLREFEQQAEQAQGRAQEQYEALAEQLMQQLETLAEQGQVGLAQLEELLQELNRALERERHQRQI